MAETKNSGRIFPKLVVLISAALVIYFGLRAIEADSSRNQKNPFEYNIEAFKQIDPHLLHYDEVQQIKLPFVEATGVAVGSQDQLFVSGDNGIAAFRFDGKPRGTFQTPATASCLAIDTDQYLFMGIQGQVVIYDTSGVRQAQWQAPAPLGMFTSIAVTPAFVFVADAENLVVWKYDKSGKLVGRIGERDPDRDIPGLVVPTPYLDIAVDTDGTLWVANTGRHQMENFTLDGELRTWWGHASMELDGFAGCCNPSHFAILNDDAFVTSEKGIPRIKVYDFRGRLLSVVAAPEQFDEGTEGLDLAIDSQNRICVLDPSRKMIRIFAKKRGA